MALYNLQTIHIHSIYLVYVILSVVPCSFKYKLYDRLTKPDTKTIQINVYIIIIMTMCVFAH